MSVQGRMDRFGPPARPSQLEHHTLSTTEPQRTAWRAPNPPRASGQQWSLADGASTVL